MHNRLIEPRNDGNGNYGRKILGMEIRFGGGLDIRETCCFKKRAALRAAAHFNGLFGVDAADQRQELRGDAFRDQQRFHCVARRIALGFRIVGNSNRFIEIGLIIDINMTNAVKMLDHGYFRFFRDTRGQALAAARDDNVDHAFHSQHFTDGCAVGGDN